MAQIDEYRALNVALFFSNVYTLSTFSSVGDDGPLPQFPLSMFRLLPNLRCFATLFWMDLRFMIEC